MIKHITHWEVDREKWNAAIDASVNGMVYAKSWYLDIVSPEWQALADENYDTVFPLTCRKKYGFYYLYPPFFTQQLGIFSRNTLTTEIVNQYLNSIPEEFRFIEINLNNQNKISAPDFKITELLTHHLYLSQSYEQISKSYSENLKRNIKKANQNNLHLTTDFSNDSLIGLFRATKGITVTTLKESDYTTLETLLAECEKRGLLTKVGVKINNDLVAGVLFLKSNNEYILIFSAVNEAARETGAMSFLIDQFIQSHHNETMSLDFEGSMDKNLARFYKSFGANEVVYLQIKKNSLPFYFRWLKN